MLRVARNALILVLAFAVFVMITLILREDVAMPAWVPFDLHKDVWLAHLLKLFGILLIGPPLVSLIVSLVLLGSDPAGREYTPIAKDGMRELRLAPGAKYTCIGISVGVLAAIFLALIWQEEHLGIWLFASPVIIAFLYGLVLCFAVRARYDDKGIASIYYGLRWRRNRWEDLTGITVDPGPGDVVLRFGTAGIQRLSAYYAGIGTFMDFAHARLREADDARTA